MVPGIISLLPCLMEAGYGKEVVVYSLSKKHETGNVFEERPCMVKLGIHPSQF